MKGFPVMEIIGNIISAVVKVADDAYKAGWMLYLMAGLIILAVIVIIYS